MDHALCIIHHVIGSLSDSTPCWRYRVPRHGTAWHGLVKHKHRETINKRNVARMPRHVSVLPLKPNGGKMSPSLSLYSSVSLFLSRVLAATFRSDSVSLLVYEGNAIRPRPRHSVVGAFFRSLEHPRKEKPNHHFSIQPLDLSRICVYAPEPLWRYCYVLFRYYAKLFSLFVRIYCGNLRRNQSDDSNEWGKQTVKSIFHL